MVEYAKVNEGATLLDVARGKGSSLFPAIHSVGENVEVVGIDFSQEMVKELQSLICAQGLYNAKIIQIDAEILDIINNYFDYVLCGLSTSFFFDSTKATGEMYRVLKNEGRLGLSTWKKREKKGVVLILGRIAIRMKIRNNNA